MHLLRSVYSEALAPLASERACSVRPPRRMIPLLCTFILVSNPVSSPPARRAAAAFGDHVRQAPVRLRPRRSVVVCGGVLHLRTLVSARPVRLRRLREHLPRRLPTMVRTARQPMPRLPQGARQRLLAAGVPAHRRRRQDCQDAMAATSRFVSFSDLERKQKKRRRVQPDTMDSPG